MSRGGLVKGKEVFDPVDRSLINENTKLRREGERAKESRARIYTGLKSCAALTGLYSAAGGSA
jgi:predicted anti-sigma-YlaC factor YlaD